MKRVLLVVFTLVLNASLAFAQDVQSSSGDSNFNSGSSSLRTFRGCLSRSVDEYELTVGGVALRRYHLLGANLAQLEGKAGHMVSITGTMQENSQSGDTNMEHDIINFLSVDDLASTCSAAIDRGARAETPHSIAAALTLAQKPWQFFTESSSIFSMPDPQAHPESYIIVPLVGGLALGLLQVARYWRRK